MYTCPMHPEIRQEGPGNCPKCGMNLVPEETLTKKEATKPATEKSFVKTYQPLFVIVGLIVIASAFAAFNKQDQTWVLQEFMQNWMAGFFLVFSGFKLLDIPGFAKGYAEYDLLGKKWNAYGFIYPFIELGLGLLYLLIPTSIALNLFTLVLMTFSGIGVAIKVAKRERFQCACLGTFIDVPLTKVTLVEDFGMAIMSLLMLILM